MNAVVVIPARNEQQRIDACLRALAAQAFDGAFGVVLVDDGSTDATVARARAVPGLDLTVIAGPQRGPGPARQAGLDLAARRLPPDGLLASTDADTVVPPDWLARQRAVLDRGADAVGGWIELDAAEAALLPVATLAARDREAVARLEHVRRRHPDAEHHHFAGASIGLRAATWAALGHTMPIDLEDAALADALHAAGARIARSRAVSVVTSARTDGRAARGLAADLRLATEAAPMTPHSTAAATAPHATAAALAPHAAAAVGPAVPAREAA